MDKSWIAVAGPGRYFCPDNVTSIALYSKMKEAGIIHNLVIF